MVENFEAIIGANIRDFQQSLSEVDAIIRETALGAEAFIGADISEFVQESMQVESTIEDIASGENEATIGADISEFIQEAAAVEATISEITDGQNDAVIGADISEFVSEATVVQSTMQDLVSGENDVTVGSDISEFVAEAAVVQTAINDIANESPEVMVTADISDVVSDVAIVQTTLWSLVNERFVIPIRVRWENYQNAMGAIANFSRSIGEVMQINMRGLTMGLSPALVPILATVVGLIGQLGPMLGVVAGSSFALVSAFATAGIGAAAFGAIATTNLKAIFDKTAELNAEQQKGRDALDGFKKTWSEIAGAFQSQTISIFTDSLNIMSGVLVTLKPMFEGVMDAAVGLTESLGKAINAKPMQDFFAYLNATAGPMFETISKAVGNFFQGFFSMMTAFSPLATETAGGFLKMSEGFATWAAGLSESKKFQAFVDYVSENMPKIRSIFSDAIQGMINMFAAFAPSSEDMMTGLEDMMERFKNWSASMSESKGFQSFIDYIKENGPKVVALIGNITNFLVNLGIALAPMGSFLLDVVNGFISFTSELLKNNPLLGSILAVVVVLTGALIFLAPNIIAMATLFAGVGAVLPAVSAAIALWRAKLILGVTMAIASLRTLVVQAVTTAASMVVAFARMVASAVVTAAQFVARIAVMIAQWVLLGAQSLLHAARVAAAWLLTTGVAMVTAVASMVATAAVFVAKWVWMGAQALFAAARMAVAWFIALGPIGWVTGAVIGIAALIIANWDKISAWTAKAWAATTKFVTDAVSKIADWIQAKFPALYNVIASYMTMAKDIISASWNYIKGTFANVLAFLSALVKGDFEGMKSAVSNQMTNIKTLVTTIWNAIKSHFSAVLTFLLTTVGAKFTEIVSSVRAKMDSVKTTIQSKWEEAKAAAVTKMAAILSAVISKFAEIASNVRNKMTEAKEALSNKWEEAKTATSTKLATLVTSVGTFFTNLVTAVKTKMTEAVTTVGTKVGEMPGKVREFVGDMMSAGGALVQGLIDGIKNMGSSAVEAISGVVGGVISKAKSLLDINSPSRVFTDFGAFISEGLAIGVESKESAAVRAVTSMASAMTDAFNPQFSTAGVNIGMASMDINRDLDGVGAQVRRDLKVDANVNHSGSESGQGFQQTVNIYSPTELSPADNARALRRVSQQQAMQWGLT